jgi:hypothetical protein
LSDDNLSAELDAIGTDAKVDLRPTDLAKREEQEFGLAKQRENNAHELRKTERDLGRIGKVFGTRENAITYIVAALALICILLVAAFSFGDQELTKIAVEFFKAVAFAGVGFITGKSLERSRD